MELIRRILTVIGVILCCINMFGKGNNKDIGDIASQWQNIDNLMQKPALTSAATALGKLDKQIASNGTDADRLRALIYHFAIDYGCEYSLFDNGRAHYANYSNPEEGEQIVCEAYNKARSLMFSLKEPALKAISLCYMSDMLDTYNSIGRPHKDRTEVEFDEAKAAESDKAANKLGIWKDRFASDYDLKQYKALRMMSVKEMQEASQKDIEKLQGGLKKELESYVFANHNDSVSAYGYLFKDLKDYKQFSLLSDFVVSILAKEDYIRPMEESGKVSSKLFWPWEDNEFVAKIKKSNNYGNLGMLYNMYQVHKERGERDAAAYYFIKYGDYAKQLSGFNNIASNKEYQNACDKFLKENEGNPCVIPVANRKSELMLFEYNTRCLPEEMTKELPQQILDFCDKYINAFPNTKGVSGLKNTKEIVLRPAMNVELKKQTISTKEPLKLSLKYANIDKVKVQLMRCNLPWKECNDYDKRKYLKNSSPVKLEQSEFSLKKTNYYIKESAEIEIAKNLKPGLYLIKIESDASKNSKQNEWMIVRVSDIFTLALQNSEKDCITYTLDRATGHPLQGVLVESYTKRVNQTLFESKTTDANGRCLLNKPENYDYYGIKIHTVKGDDAYNQTMQFNFLNNPFEQSNSRECRIFTDRAVYRPGQTIHIKVLVYEKRCEGDRIVTNENVKVIVTDAQWQVIKNATLELNEYGSATLDVEIPSGCMNGVFHIKANVSEKGSRSEWYETTVNVEEYVRTKYDARIEGIEGVRAFGNEITLKGIAEYLSGEPIANADITAKIVSRNMTRWYYEEAKFDSTFTARTDGEGRFTIKFTPEDKSAKDSWKVSRYELEGYVNIPSGEPLKFDYSFSVASKDISLAIDKTDGKDNYEISEPIELKLSSKNLSGEAQKRELTLTLTNAKDSTKKVLGKYSVDGELAVKLDPKSIGIGEWIISAECDDVKEYEEWRNRLKVSFCIYDKNSTLNPSSSRLWVSNDMYYLGENEDAELYIASSAENARVLLIQRTNDNAPTREEWIKLSNSMSKVSIKYRDVFTTKNQDEKASITLLIIIDNEVYEKTISIDKKSPDYSLPIKLKSFRDNILPGSKQRWTLEIEGKDKEAEILALMYDASLDYYKKYSLPGVSHYQIKGWQWRMHKQDNYSDGLYFETPLRHTNYNYTLASSEGLWSNAVSAYRKSRFYGDVALCAKSYSLADGVREEEVEDEEIYMKVEASAPKMAMRANTAGVVADESAAVAGGDNGADKVSHPKPRENFAETAFFYPTLRAESDGIVEFEFETPESLTSWRFIAFAHNKGLKTGRIIQSVKTSQPITVRASLPRFMRREDTQALTATVTRLSDLKDAKVRVVVSDAFSGKKIFEDSKRVSFSGNSETVSFLYKVPKTLSAATVEFYVETDGFTDGERHKLAVLNNSEHIVKSVNLIVKGGTEKSFDLPKSDKDAVNREVTVQYSANAAWNVVMALPSATYREDDAISLASAMYVNALAGNIAQTYPEIKRQVQKWNDTASVSPLEKNNDVKSILLAETPWVCDAERETKWRSELVKTLDSDRAKRECNEILTKLKELQCADGGFSWYKSDRSSYYTTLIVCEMLGKMHHRGLLTSVSGAKDMFAKALKYIDKQTEEDYEKYFKKLKEKDKYVGEYDLHAMMIRIGTQDIHRTGLKVGNIYKEYLDYANKKWVDFTLYGKASLALLDYEFDRKSTAKKIIEALREGYTKDDVEGIYWKSNQDFSRVYSSAILRQALCIRAFAKIDPKKEEIEMMKQWLIVRKSRTMWESNIATVDAIDAVLYESEHIASNNITSTLKMGDIELTASTQSGNDGYVQYSSKVDEIPSSINVKQAENAVGIGAVYVSYDARLENITANASGISVEKQTYRLSQAKEGKDRMVLKEIKKGEELKVGDRVKVVVKIHNNQDLDFVALKDRRPACLEPDRMLSGYRYSDGSWYYQTLKDASMMYMFDRLQKGTFVFEYEATVAHTGEYQSGTAVLQSVYCPSYNANSKTEAIKVKSK